MSLTPARLRRWRLNRGWTVFEASKWYGVHRQTWVKWERGERRIPPHVQRRLEATPPEALTAAAS